MRSETHPAMDEVFGCDDEVDDDDDMVWNFKVCPITTTAHILSHITLELFSVLN